MLPGRHARAAGLSCIVVGPSCTEDAVSLLPGACRDLVNEAYVVQVGTPLHNLDAQVKRFRMRKAQDVHVTTVFYWCCEGVSPWPEMEYNPRAPSQKSPHVIMWSRGEVRGVDARGLQGSVEKKDTDTGTQTCVLRLCNCVFCFPKVLR